MSRPTPTVHDFLPTIVPHAGDRYVFGAEVEFHDPDPDEWDCSELLQWALAGRLGVPFPDGAINQWAYCRGAGAAISVPVAIDTFGALLFRIGVGAVNHVAVSLGDTRTFEARGAAYGVNYFTALGRTWTHGALVPGLDYTEPAMPTPGDWTAQEKRLMFEVLARLDDKGTETINRVKNAERDALVCRQILERG